MVHVLMIFDFDRNDGQIDRQIDNRQVNYIQGEKDTGVLKTGPMQKSGS